MQEIWRKVEGYEQLYRVSNLGRVRSLARVVKVKYQKTVIGEDGTRTTVEVRRTRRFGGCVLRPCNHSKGYFQVGLYKSGKLKKYFVHDLVAKAFIPNPEGKPQVNHLDGNKQNNRVENLEWATASENMKHAFRMGLGKSNLPPYDPNQPRDKHGRFAKKKKEKRSKKEIKKKKQNK